MYKEIREQKSSFWGIFSSSSLESQSEPRGHRARQGRGGGQLQRDRHGQQQVRLHRVLCSVVW